VVVIPSDVVKWIELAQDKDHRQTFVGTVKNMTAAATAASFLFTVDLPGAKLPPGCNKTEEGQLSVTSRTYIPQPA
jgi:hypothetical protein